MDHTNPDFVPSVFECIDPNQSPKKNAKRYVNKSFISKTTCILFTFDSKLSCCVWFDQNRAIGVLGQLTYPITEILLDNFIYSYNN